MPTNGYQLVVGIVSVGLVVEPDLPLGGVIGTDMRAEEGKYGENGVMVRGCYKRKYTDISLNVGWH